MNEFLIRLVMQIKIYANMVSAAVQGAKEFVDPSTYVSVIRVK